MELNKKYTVKNKAGIMTIMPIEIINKDIGNADFSLGNFKGLRIEFYKEDYISIYSQYENPDRIIYFIERPQFDGDNYLTYKCKIVESEIPEHNFNRIEWCSNE